MLASARAGRAPNAMRQPDVIITVRHELILEPEAPNGMRLHIQYSGRGYNKRLESDSIITVSYELMLKENGLPMT